MEAIIITLEEFKIKITADTDSATSKINGLKSAVSGIAKIAAGAVAAVGAGTVAIGKAALDSYASYEQLAGGVDKIFGDASDTVKKFADDAYKTAGIGANQYMEQVTSFSAALLNSLGNDSAKAAEAANQAIIDMADNANTFGTSIESIQNAYQGFAKQNYTMLDNLKLGYGGTKQEMERLLADAEKISGIKYDISNLNDVYSAIHVIQTELNVTGTTAKEASTTIEGSINSMKASWQNLLTSLMSGVNIENATKNFIGSFSTMFNNIVALIPNFMNSLLTAIQSGLPQILPPLLDTINTILPDIVDTAVKVIPMIITAIVAAFPDFTQALIEMLPMLVEGVISLVEGLIEAAPDIIAVLIPLIPQITIGIIETIWNELPTLLSALLEVITSLAKSLLDLITDALSGIWNFITNWIETSDSFIATAIRNGIDFIKTQIDVVINFFKGLFSGIKQIADGIVQIFKGDFKNGIKTALEGIKSIFSSIWNAIWATMKNILNSIIKGVENMVNSCVRGLNRLLSPLRNAGNKLLGWLGIDFSIPEFSEVSLPRLAKGGIAYGDTIARVGEYAGASSNPEVIAPLSKLSGLINNKETNDLLRELITLVDTKEFKSYISSREVGKAAVNYINTQSRIAGGSIV